MNQDRIKKLQLFLAESPDDAFLNYALANEYVSIGNDNQAALIFEQLLAKHPNYSATYYHLGKLLERKDDKEAARVCYEKGIAVTQQNKELHALAELRSALNNLLDDDY